MLKLSQIMVGKFQPMANVAKSIAPATWKYFFCRQQVAQSDTGAAVSRDIWYKGMTVTDWSFCVIYPLVQHLHNNLQKRLFS